MERVRAQRRQRKLERKRERQRKRAAKRGDGAVEVIEVEIGGAAAVAGRFGDSKVADALLRVAEPLLGAQPGATRGDYEALVRVAMDLWNAGVMAEEGEDWETPSLDAFLSTMNAPASLARGLQAAFDARRRELYPGDHRIYGDVVVKRRWTGGFDVDAAAVVLDDDD